ncbi:hypothetical protein [Zooshikella harenae]|uniref:Uncharacterized protein n=1 Tax=Zooshikella harenae TaxID=2827238 RepID=A0ABS5ZBP5_9GAMM|nr:hypothetical protein [Zooshikella harenae]MBU2711400.1 hypothetical protein [Zooshikella harenae]
MKHLISLLKLTFFIAFFTILSTATQADVPVENFDKIAEMLKQSGKLSETATEEETEQAVKDYIRQRTKSFKDSPQKPPKKMNLKSY